MIRKGDKYYTVERETINNSIITSMRRNWWPCAADASAGMNMLEGAVMRRPRSKFNRINRLLILSLAPISIARGKTNFPWCLAWSRCHHRLRRPEWKFSIIEEALFLMVFWELFTTDGRKAKKTVFAFSIRSNNVENLNWANKSSW